MSEWSLVTHLRNTIIGQRPQPVVCVRLNVLKNLPGCTPNLKYIKNLLYLVAWPKYKENFNISFSVSVGVRE